MDKQVCLMLIRQELVDLHHQRRKLIKACEAEDFRAMSRLISVVEYTSVTRLKNLIARDGFEDWGSVAEKERAGGGV